MLPIAVPIHLIVTHIALNNNINIKIWHLVFSAHDGTVRVWNPGSGNVEQTSLEATLVFHKSLEVFGNDLLGEAIAPLAWSPSGRFIAGAIGSSLNVWLVPGK